MVAHQTIGVEGTIRHKKQSLLVASLRQTFQNGDHQHVVFIVLKDILSIDTPEHYMVNASSAFLPYLPCHIVGVRLDSGAKILTYSQTSKYYP